MGRNRVSELTGQDSAAVERVVENWNQAWRTRDARLGASDYSDDADWMNAFGQKAKGRAEIQQVLERVFSLPFVMTGHSRVVEQTIGRLSREVAVVWTKVERTGQLTPSGESLGTRHTTHCRILTKLDVNWKIVAHLISDARSTDQPEH